MTDLTFNLTQGTSMLTKDIATTSTSTMHAVSVPEIILVTGIFCFLAYWYNEVTTNKDKYEAWMNPKGRTINLYKLVRAFFWIYTVLTMIMMIIQILTV